MEVEVEVGKSVKLNRGGGVSQGRCLREGGFVGVE